VVVDAAIQLVVVIVARVQARLAIVEDRHNRQMRQPLIDIDDLSTLVDVNRSLVPMMRDMAMRSVKSFSLAFESLK